MKPGFTVSLAVAVVALSTADARAADYNDALGHVHWLDSTQAKPLGAAAGSFLDGTPTFKKTARGYDDECGTPARPKRLSLDVGGTLGTIPAIVIDNGGCYGAEGSQFTVFDSRHHVLFQGSAASIGVLPTTHDGVRDIGLGLPGPTVPLFRWSATDHAFNHFMDVNTD